MERFFWTVDEKIEIIDRTQWVEDVVEFYAFAQPAAHLKDVMRYRHKTTGVHFWTIDPATEILADYQPEGPAFIARPTSSAGTALVYRYTGPEETFFYSFGDSVPPGYQRQGPAFYASRTPDEGLVPVWRWARVGWCASFFRIVPDGRGGDTAQNLGHETVWGIDVNIATANADALLRTSYPADAQYRLAPNPC